MAANPQSPLTPSPVHEQYHVYHAEAYILNGELESPIKRKFEDYGRVGLEHTRSNSLITQSVGETNIEGLISFKRGYTRVAGAYAQQKTDIYGQDHAGWQTLASAVLEGYNVEDILTVDRVVAQLSTQHPVIDGHVPRVNFFGSRFENLRIGGYPVEVELDLAFCGPKPGRDLTYLQDGGFLDRVHRQVDNILDSDDLPDTLEETYKAEITTIDRLKENVAEIAKSGAAENGNGYAKLRCSLVKEIRFRSPHDGKPVKIPGVRTFGNAIFIGNFGTIYLAELKVETKKSDGLIPHRIDDPPVPQPRYSNHFSLEMVRLELGCPQSGNSNGGHVAGNGNTYP